MSEEMQKQKTEDEQKLKTEEEAIKNDLKDMKSDTCPYCLQSVSSYPYVNFHPVLGWLECCSCGIVFSPRSIRNVKIRKSTSLIETPKLIIPR